MLLCSLCFCNFFLLHILVSLFKLFRDNVLCVKFMFFLECAFRELSMACVSFPLLNSWKFMHGCELALFLCERSLLILNPHFPGLNTLQCYWSISHYNSFLLPVETKNSLIVILESNGRKYMLGNGLWSIWLMNGVLC